jgi:serine phosphatase RsbU (regulator of sigma subunit)
MQHAETAPASSTPEPRRADLGLLNGVDIHARYQFDRTGGDFFDAVRVGDRVAFMLSDIAGRRPETDAISIALQQAFRARSAELFGAGDANLTEATEMLVQAINLALMGESKTIRFAPTMLGCYDVPLGILAYINAGGQTAIIQDSDGTRPLPAVSLPLGLMTHLTFEASMQAFEPGAKLLVVTKGVTESMRGKVPFGAGRVREVLEQAPAASAEGLCHAVLDASFSFEKRRWASQFRKTPREDMTALALLRIPSV